MPLSQENMIEPFFCRVVHPFVVLRPEHNVCRCQTLSLIPNPNPLGIVCVDTAQDNGVMMNLGWFNMLNL